MAQDWFADNAPGGDGDWFATHAPGNVVQPTNALGPVDLPPDVAKEFTRATSGPHAGDVVLDNIKRLPQLAVDGAPVIGGAIGGALGGPAGAVVGGATGSLVKNATNAYTGAAPTPTTAGGAALDVVKQGALQGGLEAVPAVLSGLMKRGSLRLMQSALKPTETLAKARAAAGFGSKEAIAQAVLDDGRIVTRGSLGKAQDALDATDSAAQAALKGGAGRGVTVDPQAVTQAVRDQGTTGAFGRQINAAPDTSAIEGVAQSFERNPEWPRMNLGSDVQAPAPADLAHEFATNTGTNLKGKFGRLGGATVEAEKAGRASITGQLRMKIPELEPLWQQEAQQITTRDALEQAIARRANTDPLGLSTVVGAVRSPALALTAALDRGAAVKSISAQGLKAGAGYTSVFPSALRAAILARLTALEPPEDPQGR